MLVVRKSQPAELKSFIGKVCESGGSGNERDITINESNAGVVGYLELWSWYFI